MYKKLVLIAVCFLLLARPVSAQSANFLQSLDSKITTYRSLINDYRSKEDQFSIAANQYYNLKTLRSQEEAVIAARVLFVSRADVMISYLETLKFALTEGTGVELSRRDVLIAEIDNFIIGLKVHRQKAEIATDRLLIEEQALYFENLEKSLISVIYRALSLYKIGQMQGTLDQVKLVQTALTEYIANSNLSATAKNEKQRGMDELERNLTEIQLNITNTLVIYDEEIKRFDSGSFRTIQTSLSKGFTILTQTINFTKELAQ